MNFVNMLIRMFARRAIFGSGRKLVKNWQQGKAVEEIEEVDMSTMTAKEKRAHKNRLARQQRQSSMTGSNPWVLVLLIVIGLLILYISTMKK